MSDSEKKLIHDMQEILRANGNPFGEWLIPIKANTLRAWIKIIKKIEEDQNNGK